MKKKVITLEVLEDNQNTMGSVTLINSIGDIFSIPNSYRNEELIDFIKRSELKPNVIADYSNQKSDGKNI